MVNVVSFKPDFDDGTDHILTLLQQMCETSLLYSITGRHKTINIISASRQVRGRSQLSTFMKAYREYARGRGSGTTVCFFPKNQHFICYH